MRKAWAMETCPGVRRSRIARTARVTASIAPAPMACTHSGRPRSAHSDSTARSSSSL
ncbi:hypothetical protein [Thermocatellispora tengchongensis]|uniref:hypothetical protein n=1 Tax=Thermocatellispora tengchongensis TaxID=1073253 RepID=UPI0036375A8B